MACRLAKRYMGGSTAFNGTTSTIPTTLTSNDVFTTGNGFTLWAWIKPRSLGESSVGVIHDKSDSSTTLNGFSWRLTSNNRLTMRVNEGASITSSSNAFGLNGWNLVLVTVSANGTISHYSNGVISGTPATSGLPSGISASRAFTVANRAGATDGTFNGNIAEAGIIPRVATAEEIRNIYINGIIPDDTAHFWKLDDQPSTYTDTIGGATGTGTATTWSEETPTQLPIAIDESNKSSLSFDGVDDQITTVYEVPATALYSFSGKCYRRNNTATHAMIGTTNGSTGMRLHCVTGTNNIRFQANLGTGGGGGTVFTNVAKLKEWFTWTLTYDRVTAKLYINGILVGSNALTENFENNVALAVGKYGGGGAEFFNGFIKNTRAWNLILTDTEIRNLHFSNIVPYEDDPSKLVLNLTLNEGAGTIAYDSSGNANDGTISGATWSDELPSQSRTQYAGNLVKNGDFSYVPVVNVAQTTVDRWFDGTASGSTTNKLFNWYLNSVATSVSAIFDTSTLGPTGKPSLKLSTLDATGRCYVSGADALTPSTFLGDKTKLIRLKPSTSYTLSGWVKTINCVSDSAYIELISFNGNYQIRTETQSNKLSGTNNWTFCTVTFTTASDRCYAYPQLRIEKAGNISDAWFSDISLTETTPPTRTTATTRTAVTCP